ncbi:MAG: hypothetical protein RSF89_06620, partial [Oscillospiraceae bacterium]
RAHKEVQILQGRRGKIAPNLLERNLEGEKPNRKLVINVTEFKPLRAKTLSEHSALNIVTEMLKSAFEKIPSGTNAIPHSDQFWQYQQGVPTRSTNGC